MTSPPASLLLLLLPALAAAADVVSLDGARWTVRNANGSVRVPATVPGGVYTDLRAAGVLSSDFFFGHNDELYRWVSYDNWTYELTFEVDESLLRRRHAQVVLHGADTVAEVWLNGQRLGGVENMFVRYALAATGALRAGANRLAVNFTAAPVEARRRYEAYRLAHGYAVPPECVPDDYHGECHANHLRKMQASFSWDWGPAFPSEGLWKSVALEAFDAAVVRDVIVRFAEPAGEQGASLHVRAFLELGPGAAPLEGTLAATLQLPQGPARASAQVQLSPDARGHAVADLTVTGFDEPPRWWPNGEGEQTLLPLTVSFTSGGESSEVTRRIAYRTIELVQDPVTETPEFREHLNVSENDINYGSTEKGLTFYFRVNGRPIFAKGSNWIPVNVLPELGGDPAHVRYLLESARDTHTNMVRVWGGGVYESDLFYELADEMGILIWQDLMFACSMYPADEAFLALVQEEVEQQVRRLQAHASVALWAGNNENEGALVDNWYGTGANFQQYKSDYVNLYANTIRPLVLELDPTRDYVVSSPSNGLETDKEGYVSTNPGNALYGDVHYYDYVADGWNADTYRRPRFASEYGFQSMPALATLRSAVANASELAVESELMASRNHHPDGYSEMALLAAKRLPLPDDWRSPQRFDAFIYLTQIYQAVATQTQTEHYRRLRSQLLASGEGLCMGALYWQLNDLWQAPTWASIDSAGRWKPLQYLAGEFFAPQMASAYVDTAHRVHVWALNDRPEPVDGVVLQARPGRWDALPEAGWQNVSDVFTLAAAGSQHVLTADVAPWLASLRGCEAAAERCFVLLRLLAVADAVPLGPERAVLPVAPRLAQGLEPADIQVASVSGPGADGALEVALRTDRPAPFVWLEAGAWEGRFSRNAFLLADGAASVRFLPRAGAAAPSAAQLRAALTVTSVAAQAVTRTAAGGEQRGRTNVYGAPN
ncbi:hypothetical protein R5R35_000439 [Gryllus longicercus]|uniref:beta-mannosidase n=1 Tax=Gryllus longicercus TaxID=2509291 RepID=A0AAN9VAW8_9ORTH